VNTKSNFKDICKNLEIELVDEDEFLNLLNINTNKINNKKINYIFENIDNVLQLKNEKAIVFEVNTKDFVSNVNGIKDYSLFDLNVRNWLGKNKIYKEIRKRLKELKENGVSQSNNILYHNGITIICEKYEYNEEENKIIVKNMKIVNGAQSIFAFYDNKDLLDDNNTILIKLIMTTDENLIKNISYFSNNQAQVKIKDLRSLHKKVLNLENIFKNSTKYRIKIKAGKDNLNCNDELVIVEFDKLAQLITSFYLNKSYIAHNKSKILEKYFHEIFSHEFTKYHYELLLDIYFEIEKFLKKKKENASDKSDIILSSLNLTEFFILDLLSFLIKEFFHKNFFNQNDLEEIIRSFDEKTDLWLKYIEVIFSRLTYQLKNTKGNFFNKDYRKIIKNEDENKKLKNTIFEKFKENINIGLINKIL
jgi:hypothetical protein